MKIINVMGQAANKVFPAAQNEKSEISFVDVKALYDAAYAEKDKARCNLLAFRGLMRKAKRLEAAYLAQLNDNRYLNKIGGVSC